jgi:hypothetical protein
MAMVRKPRNTSNHPRRWGRKATVSVRDGRRAAHITDPRAFELARRIEATSGFGESPPDESGDALADELGRRVLRLAWEDFTGRAAIGPESLPVRKILHEWGIHRIDPSERHHRPSSLRHAVWSAQSRGAPAVRITAALAVAREPERYSDTDAFSAFMELIGQAESGAFDRFGGRSPLDPSHPSPPSKRVLSRIFGKDMVRLAGDPWAEFQALRDSPRRRRAWLVRAAESTNPAVRRQAELALSFERGSRESAFSEGTRDAMRQSRDAALWNAHHAEFEALQKTHSDGQAREIFEAGPLAKELLREMLAAMEAFASGDRAGATEKRRAIVERWNKVATKAKHPWRYLAALCTQCGRPVFLHASERLPGGGASPPTLHAWCRDGEEKRLRRSGE